MSAETSFFNTPSPARYKGLGAWLLTTDHKRIGLMYLVVILFWFAIGVTAGLFMRTQLMSPGSTLMEAQTYNAFFTVHGVIMIFLFIIPGIPAIFGNFLLPIQIGAEDVFFPRLNLLSWYLYVAGGIIAIISLFVSGAPDTGWTFYVPFSITTKTGVSITVFAVFVLGMSSMLTGINFITTVHRLRHRDMGWMQIPLFTWSVYGTAWVQLLATPVIAVTLLVVIFERLFGVGLFDPAKGGDPILFQHLFWMYSHPAVYIMILPGMGIISEVFPVFSRKSVFGYKSIVAATMAIAVVGSFVWAHHMFVSGMSDTAVLVFSFLTFAVAVPSAVKVFNWVSTMYRGSIHVGPPFLFAMVFIFLFTVGGLTGLVQGAAGPNVHIHDTHWVVGHFHFVMFGGTGFAFFAGLHFWWPKFFGRMYNFRRAYAGAVLMAAGFIMHYLPMFILGLKGMPRRYYTYLPEFGPLNFIAGIGAYIMVAGIVLTFVNLLLSFRKAEPAGPDPWGGTTLEWTVPSPPPVQNFAVEPVVLPFPYDFTAKEKMKPGSGT
ncbi:MAG: cytochrome c oxidase subunit I [Spirochaetes bacterium]|nr:MAG: cytochrome c oxidase subunit I [Spirochaetota bacterium]